MAPEVYKVHTLLHACAGVKLWATPRQAWQQQLHLDWPHLALLEHLCNSRLQATQMLSEIKYSGTELYKVYAYPWPYQTFCIEVTDSVHYFDAFLEDQLKLFIICL